MPNTTKETSLSLPLPLCRCWFLPLPLLLCCCCQCLKGDKHACAAAVTIVVASHVLLHLLVSLLQMLLLWHMLCCQFVFKSVLCSSSCYYCCFVCCYYCIGVCPYVSCCIGEYTHVLGALVQGLLLSCVQLLSMRCCCMFQFGVAVAHVAVAASLHVLLHSAGVAAAFLLMWLAAFAIAVHSTCTIAVMCAAAHCCCCCVCTCGCIRCYPHVCVCPTKDPATPFVAFSVIAATVPFIVVAACAIAYALLVKG